MAGTLYVVATPIGNLADITLRALSVLREVDLIAAEDTRVTRNLLQHYGIETPMTPYHQHSLASKATKLIEVLNEGKSIALVSDAGTPGISDPGHEIITLAIENGIPVVAVPGPNAIITAVVVSGLPTYRFAFDGFPPRRAGDRRAFFAAVKDEARTLVFYESPNRLLATLKDMRSVLGDRRIAVLREATKLFEEVFRGDITGAIERFSEVAPKGEITVVVEGAVASEEAPSEELIDDALRRLLAVGLSERDAVRGVMALYSVSKRSVYQRMIEMKGESVDEQ